MIKHLSHKQFIVCHQCASVLVRILAHDSSEASQTQQSSPEDRPPPAEEEEEGIDITAFLAEREKADPKFSHLLYLMALSTGFSPNEQQTARIDEYISKKWLSKANSKIGSKVYLSVTLFRIDTIFREEADLPDEERSLRKKPRPANWTIPNLSAGSLIIHSVLAKRAT